MGLLAGLSMGGSKIRISIDPIHRSDLDRPFLRSGWIGFEFFEIRIIIKSMDFVDAAAIIEFHRVEAEYGGEGGVEVRSGISSPGGNFTAGAGILDPGRNLKDPWIIRISI